MEEREDWEEESEEGEEEGEEESEEESEDEEKKLEREKSALIQSYRRHPKLSTVAELQGELRSAGVKKYRSLRKDKMVATVLRERLRRVVENGYLESLHDVLWHGADVNGRYVIEGRSLSLLHIAAKNGYADVAKALMKKGLEANVEDSNEESPLHYASRLGYVRVAEVLVEEGADIYRKGKYDRSPLHYASLHNTTDVVKFLVAKGADVSVTDKDGLTPLHLAASSGNDKVVKLLIEAGADIHPNGKTTILMTAVEERQVNVVRVVLEEEFKIIEQENESDGEEAESSVVVSSVEKNNNSFLGHDLKLRDAKLLRVKELKSELQLMEMKFRNSESKKELVAKVQGGHLRIFAQFGKLEEVKRLIRSDNVDVNTKSKNGRTPLHGAAEVADAEMVRVLLEAGANVHLCDHNGRAPLHDAVDADCKEAIRMLMEKGADILQENYDGESPLYLAAEMDNFDAVRILVENIEDSVEGDKEERQSAPVGLDSTACDKKMADESSKGTEFHTTGFTEKEEGERKRVRQRSGVVMESPPAKRRKT